MNIYMFSVYAVLPAVQFADKFFNITDIFADNMKTSAKFVANILPKFRPTCLTVYQSLQVLQRSTTPTRLPRAHSKV